MSAVLAQPPTAPAGPRGSLLCAEVHRFRSRRFIQVLGLFLCWLAAVVLGLTQFGHPSGPELAAARQQQQDRPQGLYSCVAGHLHARLLLTGYAAVVPAGGWFRDARARRPTTAEPVVR